MCQELQKRDSPIWDLKVWKNDSGIMNIICADDSGTVFMIDPRIDKQILNLVVHIIL